MKGKRRLSAADAAAYLALILACAFSLAWFARYGMHNQNADLSSEMVYADLLNEEGRLLTDSWYYSTELRSVSPTPLYQLGLLLFPESWHAARTFAVAAMTALTLASFLFMARGVGMGRARVWCAAVLALPLCDDYSVFCAYGLFYSAYLALIFLILGLLARFAKAGAGRRARGYAALAAGLAFYGGLGGVRMVIVCAAPLGLFCALTALSRAQTCASWREAARSAEGRLLLAAAAVAAGTLAGYAVNAAVLSRLYDFAHFEQLGLRPVDWGALGEQIGGILLFFGYRGDAPAFSLRGMASLAGLCLAAGALLGARALLRRTELPPERRLPAGFALCALALGVGVNVLTGMETIGYYIFALTMLVAVLFAAIWAAPCRLPGLREAALIAVTAAFALNAAIYLRTDMTTQTSPSEEAAAYLTQQGYTQGYATFWNASPLTEASDGAIEVYSVKDFETLALEDTLQKKAHFERPPQGRVFALLFWDEVEQGLPEAFEAHRIAELAAGCVYGFDSDAQLRQALGVSP